MHVVLLAARPRTPRAKSPQIDQALSPPSVPDAKKIILAIKHHNILAEVSRLKNNSVPVIKYLSYLCLGETAEPKEMTRAEIRA